MTTPDRLAAAVAQGHEDAVQVGPQEDGCACGTCGRFDMTEHHGCRFDDGLVTCGCGVEVALSEWNGHATPAPVSSPAGEDVERVAREEAERRYRDRNDGDEPYTYPAAALRVHARGAFIAGARWFAALSARPVEAQEGIPARVALDRATRMARERDAALARAEAAEAAVRACSRSCVACGSALRALLDGEGGADRG